MGYTNSIDKLQKLWRLKIMYYKQVFDINEFEFWGGGLDTFNELKEHVTLEQIQYHIENHFSDEIPTDTDINDYLWYERDEIFAELGIKEKATEEDIKDNIKELLEYWEDEIKEGLEKDTGKDIESLEVTDDLINAIYNKLKENFFLIKTDVVLTEFNGKTIYEVADFSDLERVQKDIGDVDTTSGTIIKVFKPELLQNVKFEG